MIAIIDYGMGNLRSVVKGFERVGVKVFLTGDPVLLEQAGGVVLPGVGAFADAMVNLRTTGMDLAVHRAVQAGKLFLGICLGQQLLFEFSEEWGLTKGLGIFPGGVKRLPPALKVPIWAGTKLKYSVRTHYCRVFPTSLPLLRALLLCRPGRKGPGAHPHRILLALCLHRCQGKCLWNPVSS